MWIDEIVEVFDKVRKGQWVWPHNMRCKYIEVSVDMRDLRCTIKDRNGIFITVYELKRQEGRDKKQLSIKSSIDLGKMVFKEGDEVFYNWLSDTGEDNWKLGKIVKVDNRLMGYFDDVWRKDQYGVGVEKHNWMPLNKGMYKVVREEEFCMWSKEDQDNDSYYETSCGGAFQCMNGDHQYNHFLYCPYCGKPIKDKIKEEEDEIE